MSRRAPVVLITGCSAGGIGFALSEEFAARGCQVYATARDLSKVKGLSHASIQTLVLDVCKEEHIQRVVKHIIEVEGRIDILVNNAGTGTGGPLMDVPLNEVENAFNTNVYATLRLSQAVMPHMAARKSGTIIIMGSILGNTPVPWSGIYGATKHALRAIADIMHIECQPFGIHVLLLAPGSVHSKISATTIENLHLPENSLYRPYNERMLRSLNVSDKSRAMPTAEFAKTVVSAALRKNVPQYMTMGPHSALFKILAWLPRRLVLWLMRLPGLAQL